jgi:hypothetical protein
MAEIKKNSDTFAAPEEFGKIKEEGTHGTISHSPGKLDQEGFIALHIPKEHQKILPPREISSQ